MKCLRIERGFNRGSRSFIGRASVSTPNDYGERREPLSFPRRVFRHVHNRERDRAVRLAFRRIFRHIDSCIRSPHLHFATTRYVSFWLECFESVWTRFSGMSGPARLALTNRCYELNGQFAIRKTPLSFRAREAPWLTSGRIEVVREMIRP